MSGREAFNKFRNYGGKIHKKDWEEGKFIACDKGIPFFTISFSPKDCSNDRTPDRFYDQDGYFYQTLDELLSSVGLDPGYMFSEEDDWDNFYY